MAALALLALPAISIRSLDRLSGLSFLGDMAVLLIPGTGVGLWARAAAAGGAHRLHWLPSREEAGVGSAGRLALEVGAAVACGQIRLGECVGSSAAAWLGME